MRTPFSYRDEIKDLNDLARKEASGSFVQLSDGCTDYEAIYWMPCSSRSR